MHFSLTDGRLHVEGVVLDDIADQFGTPCYVYSRATLEDNWRAYDAAFGARAHRICYAVKANGNIAILKLLADLGSGFDIVSSGELERVMAAGGAPGKTVFAGVGKTRRELTLALAAGVTCFNIESLGELERLDQVARDAARVAPVAVRVNPDVDAETHPYIATGLHENKFGIPIADARTVYRRALGMPNVEPVGVACHIGSQLTSLAPVVDALSRLMELVDEISRDGVRVSHIDVGGGLGIRYREESPPTVADYVAAVCQAAGPTHELFIEPGRSIVGNAGILLTTVEYLKHGPVKNFAIVDAGMNDLIRPALYDAWHGVEPCRQAAGRGLPVDYDVVGPVCETGDFLARHRALDIAPGDRLAVTDCGAYGFVMASTYNARPRPPEILVDRGACHVIRQRETVEDLMRGERIPSLSTYALK